MFSIVVNNFLYVILHKVLVLTFACGGRRCFVYFSFFFLFLHQSAYDGQKCLRLPGLTSRYHDGIIHQPIYAFQNVLLTNRLIRTILEILKMNLM